MLHYTTRKNPEENHQRRLNIASNDRQSMEGITKKVKNYVFNLRDVLGKGSFSTVYLGHHQTTFEIVAIKVIQLKKMQSEALSELLNSEIETLQSLHHPNILYCQDVYFSATNCYIITEYCNGGDFKDILKKSGPFDEKSAEKIITEVYEGLKYLSEKNIVHRDFKTTNVFMNNGQIKIADFGFAKKIKQNFRDVSIGSPLYMSPEGLIDNIYGPKTDVWAFGIFMYELLHEKNPFHGCETKEQLRNAILQPITMQSLKPGLSFQLKKLIIDCLQIDLQSRISMQEIGFSLYFSKIKQDVTDTNSIFRKNQDYQNQKQFSGVSTEVPSTKNNYKYLTSRLGRRNEYDFDQKRRVSNSKDSSQNQKSLNYYQFSYKTIKQNKIDRQFKPITEPSKNLDCNKERSLGSTFEMRSRSYSKKQEHHLFNKTFTSTPCNNRFRQRNKAVYEPTYSLIRNVTDFRDLVALLHYCRVLFKTIKLSQKYTRINIDILGGWLIQILRNVIDNINKIQNPSVNVEELKRIAIQFQMRYENELTFRAKVETDPKKIKDKIVECLRILKTELRGTSGEKDGSQAIKYFIFIYELTDKLEVSIHTGNYQEFADNNNIEDFLLSKTSKQKNIGV